MRRAERKRLDTLAARLGNLEPFSGHRRMADLIPADVEAYKAHRLAEVPAPAPGTINRELPCSRTPSPSAGGSGS